MEQEKNVKNLSTQELIEQNQQLKQQLSQLQQALRHSEIISNNTQIDNNMGTWEIDLINNTQIWSDNYCKLMGYQEVVTSPTFELFYSHIYKDDVDLVKNTIEENISSKSPCSLEFRFIPKDGSLRYCKSTANYLFDDNNQIIKIIGVFQDITEQKDVLFKLAENEQKYKSLYDNAPLSYQSLDAHGNIIDVNPTWLKTLGYNREEVIGKKFEDFLHPDWKNLFRKNFPILKKRGYVNNVHFRIKHQKGHYLDISLEGCTGNHPDGSFKQTYCVFKDITEETKIKDNAIENKMLLEKIAENYPNSYVSIIEKDLSIGFSSGQEFKKLKLNPQDFIGLTLEQVFGEKADIVAKYYKETFKGNERNFELFINNQYQHYKTVPLYDEDEKVNRILVVVENVSSRKKKEIELVKAKEKAEESDKLKTAFLANMSHEIRTPMNGILGFVQLLQEPDIEKDEQQSFINIIQSSSIKLLHTVNDIVEISKIESGAISISKSEFDLVQLLDNLVTFFKPECHKKGIEIHIKNQIKTEQIFINTDQTKLDSIVTNLIKNAIKYTDRGFIETGIQVSNQEIIFYCKDTGFGIPKHKQKAVFNRFEQADTKESKAIEGSGLGLTIVKSYVEMLKGKIWLESEVGKGSIFYVSLPINTK
ncbi:PAS domain S-box protein [Lentimicrobium sp. L6]|uniref:PAS domain-containing sensor histidine kinase n=1 Tax=Lentimicrobium sp. L6 TaxID=2735916 RepID=UPI001551B23E|nr:PAS domain-containing protein [Lentimicrobium sp. L6]NPD86626.1 PAS domain S-box protein [Lentimicrobium sp. L6]